LRRPAKIGKYETEAVEISVGGSQLTLLKVKDLERWVDREALLRDEAEEPPYWAHLWTGALTLARYVAQKVECQGRKVLDLGCGLGLTGIVAALKGGQVTFADREAEALAFAAVNAQLNRCPLFSTQQLDFSQNNRQGTFPLILGAEIVYDPGAFPALTAFLARHLAPGGVAYLADARRTDTRAFFRQLSLHGLSYTSEEITEREDDLPLRVSIVQLHKGDNPPRGKANT
jgi:predicted nicotinamide N-methyase